MKVLLFPADEAFPVSRPKKALPAPVELRPASDPKIELSNPDVLKAPALYPKRALLEPAWFWLPEKAPKNELLLEVFNAPDPLPKKELFSPIWLFRPARYPKNELNRPIVLLLPAELPKNELRSPVVFAAPALSPANVLSVPGTLNTRFPPTLYWAVALMMLAEKVPPAVPLPLMLKFEVACCTVVFCT